MFQLIYHLGYTLEEVKQMTPLEFNWLAASLEEQKREENRAMRRRR